MCFLISYSPNYLTDLLFTGQFVCVPSHYHMPSTVDSPELTASDSCYSKVSDKSWKLFLLYDSRRIEFLKICQFSAIILGCPECGLKMA